MREGGQPDHLIRGIGINAGGLEVGPVERGEDRDAQQLGPGHVELPGLSAGLVHCRLHHLATAAGMDRDEGGGEFDHRPDAARHRVGNIVQLEVEEEAHAGGAHRCRKGVAHTRRAVREKELQPELDAADGRLRPPGDALDELGGLGEIDRVDAAIDGVRTGPHGGRNLMATPPTGNHELGSDQKLRTRRTASCQPA